MVGGVEPRLNEFSPVHLGSDAENPVMLSPCEWADVFLDQGAQIRRGDKKNGLWHVFIERAAMYEISLRRWPIEADAPISGGLPPYQAHDGRYAEGIALPIAKARLKIADFDDSRAVSRRVSRRNCRPVGRSCRHGFTTRRERNCAARITCMCAGCDSTNPSGELRRSPEDRHARVTCVAD